MPEHAFIKLDISAEDHATPVIRETRQRLSDITDPPLSPGDEVTSGLFDGTGTVEGIRHERGITIVDVRTPTDPGVPHRNGVSAYDRADLRKAGA